MPKRSTVAQKASSGDIYVGIIKIQRTSMEIPKTIGKNTAINQKSGILQNTNTSNTAVTSTFRNNSYKFNCPTGGVLEIRIRKLLGQT
jgi:hypothetical protein